MATVHILTQYIWPDAAPTGLYAEQLATRLHENGWDVCLIGGQGSYRNLARPKPQIPIIHLEHYQGRRGNLKQTLAEYASVKRVFRSYIYGSVKEGDIVIVTSAPPNTVRLARAIKRRSARAIYWLQDYYPELIRGVCEYPRSVRSALSAYWDGQLMQWDRVVKIAANVGRELPNAVVIRNWPTFTFESDVASEPRTALYSGNLGYGHDVELLVLACEELREAGYTITMRADGCGVARLPVWLQPQPLHIDPEKLKNDLLRHELHLVAADQRLQHAIFPSKIWNSIAAGRRLLCTGFSGAMAAELEETKRAPFESHLDQWMQLVVSLAGNPQANLSALAEVLSTSRTKTAFQPAALA